MSSEKKEKPIVPVSFETGMGAATFVVAEARKEKIACAVCGGLAMQIYGYIRATKDVDFIAAAPLTSVKPTRTLSFGGFAYQVGAGKKMVPVDWIVRSDDAKDLYDEALKDKIQRQGLPIISPEWMVIIKQQAGRSRDENDLLWLLREPELVDRDKLISLLRRVFGKHAYWPIATLKSEFLRADYMKARDEQRE